MDAFYEESAVNKNAKKDGKKYRILQILYYVFLVLGIVLLISCITTIPSSEATGEVRSNLLFLCGFTGVQGVFFILLWFALYKLKFRFNVSYDYCFVSGELRISKVFNISKRKLVARFDCADMIQIGDIDNPSYERFKSDPMTKEVICTPNVETSEDKFFMYILANYDGKKLFVLECRELLLMNILKFAKRGTLESDYVMQEKKQR